MNTSLWTEIHVKGYPDAQRLIDAFCDESFGKPELKRIALAKNLFETWKKHGLPRTLFPGFPDRDDYWYLVQLLGDRRHVDQKKQFLPFSIGEEKTLFVLRIRETESLSRNDADRRNEKLKDALNTEQGVPPAKSFIEHIRFDDALRIETEYGTEPTISYYHLFGYRLRDDGSLMGLIGGNRTFGGIQYIDSYWPALQLNHIHSWLTRSHTL